MTASNTENLLNEIIAAYLRELDAGQTPNREDLLARHPDLAPELGSFFANQEQINQLAKPVAGGVSDSTTGSAFPPLVGKAMPTCPGLASGLRYRIMRPHAKGGLGEVFVAEDLELHREVALKEIQRKHSDKDDNRGRFLLEAEITGRLEHPGIVPVYGLGTYDDGRPFYAMRFIRGDNLKSAAAHFHLAASAQGPNYESLEFRQLLGRFIDVCNAIGYAHSRGVLHRDLKPGNIMLGKFGETLIVDWGLAKIVGRGTTREREPAIPADEATLMPSAGSGLAETVAGSVVGTPGFMSPEQAGGRTGGLGPSTDIYGLGATLYALLTDQPPVCGTDAGEVMQRVQRGDWPRPRVVSPAIPAALDAICAKAMALRPQDRYDTALALAQDLEHWLADEPVSAYPEPLPAQMRRWGRRHRTWVAGAAVLLVTAVVALAFGLVALDRERQRTEAARTEEARRRQQAREALDALSSQVIDEWLAKQKELLPEHRVFLQKALASYEEFAQEAGQDEDTRAGVAAACRRVGKIRFNLGQSNESEAAFRRSHARALLPRTGTVERIGGIRETRHEHGGHPNWVLDHLIGHPGIGLSYHCAPFVAA